MSDGWRIGVLYSESGVTAGIEKTQANGTLLAIEEINAAGGIKSMGGAKIEALLGDAQARHLKGATGDMARQPWSVRWSAEQGPVDDEFVKWMSRGVLRSTRADTPDNESQA